MQVLARRGILRQVDFLSTVSGGGYLGAFITSFLTDTDERVELKPEAGKLPFGGANDPESQAVRHLRNHGKYLTEGGTRTLAQIVAQVVYGIIVSVLLLSPLLLGATVIAKVLFADAFTHILPWRPIGGAAMWPLIALGIAVLLAPIVERLAAWARFDAANSIWRWLCIGLGFICALIFAGRALPHVLAALAPVGGAPALFISICLLPPILGVLGLWLGPGDIGGRIAFGLFSLIGPLFLLAGFLWLTQIFVLEDASGSRELWLWILFATSVVYAVFLLDINTASPHRYYRNRLARTYMRRAIGTGTKLVDPQLLSGINAQNKAPYHLINAAVNIPACDDPNLRGRRTDFFLFSKHFCGSPIVGYGETKKWERADPRLDLGTAMAISGAAAAPRMGTLTSSRYTFLLAILNVRLGYWLRRPSVAAPMPGFVYFLRELTGRMHEKTRYLNVSDGGHIENLGIYELLRRRCKFVIAIDGEADPNRSFGGLLTLTQFASIDLGVRIEPDLRELRIDRDGRGLAHFGLSRIDYPMGEYGLLLYIKSSLTGNESEFLKKYHAENPDFPHQSTANQLFTETQFEAYRALGEHIANDLFRTDLVGKSGWDPGATVRQWFEALSAKLVRFDEGQGANPAPAVDVSGALRG